MNASIWASLALLLGSSGSADDWPQWMGRNRDAFWAETGIVDKFPVGGPKVVWQTPIGRGYSGPSVVGDGFIRYFVGVFRSFISGFDFGTDFGSFFALR